MLVTVLFAVASLSATATARVAGWPMDFSVSKFGKHDEHGKSERKKICNWGADKLCNPAECTEVDANALTLWDGLDGLSGSLSNPRHGWPTVDLRLEGGHTFNMYYAGGDGNVQGQCQWADRTEKQCTGDSTWVQNVLHCWQW